MGSLWLTCSSCRGSYPVGWRPDHPSAPAAPPGPAPILRILRNLAQIRVSRKRASLVPAVVSVPASRASLPDLPSQRQVSSPARLAMSESPARSPAAATPGGRRPGARWPRRAGVIARPHGPRWIGQADPVLASAAGAASTTRASDARGQPSGSCHPLDVLMSCSPSMPPPPGAAGPVEGRGASRTPRGRTCPRPGPSGRRAPPARARPPRRRATAARSLRARGRRHPR
jgi:hypothetical protein